MSEKFNLKWNNFQSNVSRSFSLLRTEQEFFDVSLVSEDQKMMSAHKLVLSASSPYFKHVLTQNKHSHPLLCLEGVSSAELQCVLDYIYQGEVLVYQENLDRFLEVAKRLKLEGLITQDKDEDTDHDRGSVKKTTETNSPGMDSLDTSNVSETELFAYKKLKIEIMDDSNDFSDRELSTDIKKPKRENIEVENPTKQKSKPRRRSTSSYFANAENFANNDEIDKKIQEYIIRGQDGIFSCGHCGKTGVKTKQNLVYHLETHVENLSYPCSGCEKTFRSKQALSSHKSIHRA